MERRVSAFVVYCAVFLLAACANTPVERQEATSKTSADLQEQLTATRAQVDKTLALLTALTPATR